MNTLKFQLPQNLLTYLLFIIYLYYLNLITVYLPGAMSQNI